jgi:ParB family chromosome partitioning protein
MEPLNVDGRDVDIKLLKPLHERDINLKGHAGYRKIVASMKAVGLLEPLIVYEEEGHYIILDGYLRFKACQELEIETVPCMVFKDKQAYTFNRNVNRLSAFQEMRMLRKSLEKIDEPTIAQAFGMKTIRHRLAPTLMKQLHTDVVAAFKENQLSRSTALEMTSVPPIRQAEMLEEMRRTGDFSLSFCRALILQTPADKRDPKRTYRKSWAENDLKKKDLVARLEHAEQQHDFYSSLYRQYSTDLMKLAFFVRKLITNEKVLKHMESRHPDVLSRFQEIVQQSAVS